MVFPEVGRGPSARMPPVIQPPSPAQPSPMPDTGSAGGGRILVVDDNVDAADTLSELLQMLGYETRTAGEAQAALRQLEDFRPQIALLDIGLPDVDGYELARLMRGKPQGAGLRLVALTGYGQDSDRARASEAGFDEHMVKPVAVDRLTELIARYLG
jgi:CheY-like chemotaxis protein